MADTWIKMRTTLHTHPKVVTLASRLCHGRVTVLGALYLTWCIADQHADNGKLHHLDSKALDALTEVPGFSEQMIAVGWLEETDEGLQLPNYEEHNGSTGKSRAMANRRQSRSRNMSRKCHGGVTQVSRSKRDKSVTREEKRREEKSNTPLTPLGGDDGFDEFWSAYPGRRRYAKAKCLARWRSRGLASLRREILDGLDRWKRSPEWAKDGGAYIPAPEVWLNQSRWEAQPASAPTDPDGLAWNTRPPKSADVAKILREVGAE